MSPEVINEPLDKSEDLKEYVWRGKGPVLRRKNHRLLAYKNGDKISLTPRAAFALKGDLEDLNGIRIPAHYFDGISHPEISRPVPTSPEERAASNVGAEVASKKSSLTGKASKV